MDTELLRMEAKEAGSSVTLALMGELDVSTTPQLMEEFVRLTSGGISDLDVDLAGLDYTDSSGLSVFVTAHMQCRDAGITLRFVNPSLFVTSLFEMTSLDQVLEVAATDATSIPA